MSKNAWNNLSQSEKEDLEFYTILTFLQGGGENSEYFSRITEYIEVYPVYSLAYEVYKNIKRKYDIPVIGWLYEDSYDTAKYTKNSLKAVSDHLNYYVNSGYGGLKTGIDSLNQTLASYLESSERLTILYGGGNGAGWDTVEKALNITGGLDSGELLQLEEYWNQMAGEIDVAGLALPEAVKLFAQWSTAAKEESKSNLEAFWNENYSQFAEAENDYHLVYQEYLNGTASIEQVTLAAERAYGKEFPGRKNHVENLAGSVMEDLFGFIERGKNRDAEYNSLAAEYVDLISRAYGERYAAEMAGREVEWEERRQDIQEQYREWQNSAVVMIENGRADWKQTAEKLRESYARWVKAYQDEYQRTDEAWAAAYLEGLKDKEAWVAQATRAANEASSGAVLALIGSDAEAMARAMDTRNPMGIMNAGGIEEAEATLRQLLETAGLNNLNTALSALNNSSGVLITEVRRGVGGPEGRNYGVLAAEASRLAQSAEEELAARESKRIALHVKDLTAEALKLLAGNVQEANSGFRKQMDETFILEGQWQKSGISYVKDVLVHSTLFTSIITDKASVEGYRDYIMPVLYLNTDLSEERLENLDAWAVDSLIEKMYAEVEDHAGKIFGSGADGETGEFGMHLGRQPVTKSKPDIDDGRAGVFDDYGAGEIGRLMTEFIYWNIKESYGISALSQPSWNKPLWDSRGSWFQAPTIRTITDIGVRIATTMISAAAAPVTGGASLAGAIALNSAINTADDLVFDMLDVSAGIKSWGEAGFSFGKNLLTNTVSSSAGAVFSGIGGVSSGYFGNGGLTNYMSSLTNSGIGRTMITAAMKGVEAFTTGSLTSIIGAVTYDDENGWGFSREQLAAGFTNSWKTALSSSSGSFTTGLLDLSMEGFTGNLYSNGRKLNSLTGSLASQGISYATGGDFTLNLLSTSLFSGENTPGVGLLELHLGREGVQMGLGTGGADVSMGTLISAAKGLESWKVNAGILFSGQETAMGYASQMRTLYSMGGLYREEYENYIAGRTKIAESGTKATESKYDSETGVKTVYLGSDALDDQSRFGLNVVLSHEANRDGIIGDETEQEVETERAVLGHMETALELLTTYHGGLGMDMTIEALFFGEAQRTGNYSVANAVADAYDSSADYWKLISNADGSHVLVWDGKKSLTVEYRNAAGEVISTLALGDQDYTSDMGMAESLANVIGFERAKEILGSSLDDANTYSFQTLKDVLGLSDGEIRIIQSTGVLPSNLTDKQRLALAGEALMYHAGASWNGTSWVNVENIGLTLTDNKKTSGYILAENKAEGGFAYSTVKATVIRNKESYLGWSANEGSKFNKSKQGLDALVFIKQSLDGGYLNGSVFGQFHTVDNMTKSSTNPKLNQPYQHPIYGNIQGNTIAPGSFNMTYWTTSDNYYGNLGKNKNVVMIINNATTVGGYTVSNTGNGGKDSLKWLFHANSYSNGVDYNSYYSDGCFVAPVATINSVYSYLHSLGLSKGYQIKGMVREF
ncbi:MAG: hypothetical protein LBG22_05255 [Treponema sp.]|nr:hypothetical protein [Treponema sp.]